MDASMEFGNTTYDLYLVPEKYRFISSKTWHFVLVKHPIKSFQITIKQRLGKPTCNYYLDPSFYGYNKMYKLIWNGHFISTFFVIRFHFQIKKKIKCNECFIAILLQQYNLPIPKKSLHEMTLIPTTLFLIVLNLTFKFPKYEFYSIYSTYILSIQRILCLHHCLSYLEVKNSSDLIYFKFMPILRHPTFRKAVVRNPCQYLNSIKTTTTDTCSKFL